MNTSKIRAATPGAMKPPSRETESRRTRKLFRLTAEEHEHLAHELAKPLWNAMRIWNIHRDDLAQIDARMFDVAANPARVGIRDVLHRSEGEALRKSAVALERATAFDRDAVMLRVLNARRCPQAWVVHYRMTARKHGDIALHDSRIHPPQLRVKTTDAVERELLDGAIDAGHAGFAEHLIGYGAPLNPPDAMGRTPLVSALVGSLRGPGEALASNGPLRGERARRRARCVAMVRMLIEQGADVDRASKDGFRPLHLAARAQDGAELVALLLDNGAKVSALDKQGRTALDVAQTEKLCGEEATALLRQATIGSLPSSTAVSRSKRL